MTFRYAALLALLCAAPAVAQPTTFLQTLPSPDPVVDEGLFGAAVDLGGDFLAVGKPGGDEELGAAYVYLRDSGSDTWSLQQELVTTTVQPAGEFAPAYGQAIAIDGENLVVGAPYDSETAVNSGAAILFRYDNKTSTWIEFDKFKAPEPELEDQFGLSVALSGAIAVVGAYGDDDEGDEAGAVYVYEQENESGSWTFEQKLVADDAEAGDRFGFSVAVDAQTIVVGIQNEISPDAPGAAYVFTRNDFDDPWTQVQKLQPDAVEVGDRFGTAVAVGTDAILVGAPLGGADDTGAAYVYELGGGGDGSGDPWMQSERLIASTPSENSLFGNAVSIQNGVALVGAPQESDAGLGEGAAYVFVNNGVWTPLARLEAPSPEANAAFGAAVNVNAGVAVVGSPLQDIGMANAGEVYLYGVPATSAEEDATAETFRLDAPYPNPFTTSTTFTYTLDAATDVTLTVFDVLGREVARLERGPRPAGPHTVAWSAPSLPSGVYIARLDADDTSVTRRVILSR